MGTWSTEPFGNDSAVDWSEHLEQYNDLSYIDNAFNRVIEFGDGLLDATEADEAVAAADVVARLKGKFYVRDSHTEKADAWVTAHSLTPTPELISKALRALDRVTTEPSEAYDLWREGAHFNEWKQQIDSLRARLQ